MTRPPCGRPIARSFRMQSSCECKLFDSKDLRATFGGCLKAWQGCTRDRHEWLCLKSAQQACFAFANCPVFAASAMGVV